MVNIMNNLSAYTIELDDLALALTRPPMAFGVMLKVAMINLMLCAISYAITHSCYVLIIFGLFHLIAIKLSIKEPRFIEIYFFSFIKTPPNLNYLIWGKCNSYKMS